jgi:hypothetical protein
MARAAALLVLLSLALALPSAAQISVRSDLADDRTVAPGERYTGTISVRNDTNEPQQARVYQTDYLFFPDGSNRFDDPGTIERSNADWITYTPSILILPPSATVEVSYEVAVPETLEGGEPTGSYWSMMMVEAVSPESETSTLGEADTEPEQRRLGAQQVMRYGVQVATHIDGPPAYDVALSDLQVEASDSARVLLVAAQNTGQAMMRPAVWMELYDASGEKAAELRSEPFRLYPGTGVTYRLDATRLAPGTYEALFIVDAGDDEVFGAQYSVVVEE